MVKKKVNHGLLDGVVPNLDRHHHLDHQIIAQCNPARLQVVGRCKRPLLRAWYLQRIFQAWKFNVVSSGRWLITIGMEIPPRTTKFLLYILRTTYYVGTSLASAGH